MFASTELVSSLLVLIGFLAFVPSTCALTAAEWRSRSIYQVITDRFALANGTNPACKTSDRAYCGGSWAGLISKLDYIQGAGFDAVWISPVSHQISNTTKYGQAFHGYWQDDLTKLSDSSANLLALSDALHDRGMALMVDMVVNNVAWPATNEFDPGFGQSKAGGDGAYGLFNSTSDYHPSCSITDDTNTTAVQQCWLVADPNGGVELPDLNTESTRVKSLLYNHVKQFVQTYAVDGLRIDACKHVPTAFWTGYRAAAGVFTMGEMLDGTPDKALAYQGPLDSILNYPMYFPLYKAFTSTSGSMVDLNNMIGTLSYWAPDSTLLGGFVANHDQPRPRSTTTDASLLKNLFSFSFVADGIPIWYQGDEQTGSTGRADPDNREALWTLGSKPYDTSSVWYILVDTLNAARKAAGTYSSSFYTTKLSVVTYTSRDIVVSKGPLLAVMTNRGAAQSGSSSLTVNTSYAAGTVVIDVLSCSTLTVTSKKALTLKIAGGLPQIYLPLSALTPASGLCPSKVKRAAASCPTSSTSSASPHKKARRTRHV